ncbi:hypothetical protein SE17_17090, partial [Kouleothrix aurantiaca]
MNVRRTLLLSIVAVLLAACGGSPGQPQTVSPQITLPPAATAAQSEIPSAAPEPTSAAPEPSNVPAEPTAAPKPTDAPEPTAAPAPSAAPQPTSAPTAGGPGELLFLRANSLIALGLGTRAERTIAANVIDFAPAPGGNSIALIRAHQSPNGAYVASPTFPTYHYCWFRDGTYIAYAMDLVGEHASAR